MTEDLPVAAVWKSNWLPRSETFIQNQMAAMQRWRPVPIGERRIPDGLPVDPHYAPFGWSFTGRVARRVSRGAGHRQYDAVVRGLNARLIHAHFGTSAATVLPVARRTGLPLLVTFHGFDLTREPHRQDRTGRRYAARLAEVIDQASALIAVSEFIADLLLQQGADAKKVRLLPIGIPTQAPAPTGEPRQGVLFVGRLVENKGVADLFSAMASLGELGRSVPIDIVGDGPLASPLHDRAAELGLNVHFHGFLDRDAVADKMSRAAIFCAPSKTSLRGDAEGFGMVFLEAALHGLPVVAYRHGGVRESVADGATGLLADEGDTTGLGERLRHLIDDPDEARRLGAAGRARVLAEYDIRSRTAALEQLYDEVAGR